MKLLGPGETYMNMLAGGEPVRLLGGEEGGREGEREGGREGNIYIVRDREEER